MQFKNIYDRRCEYTQYAFLIGNYKEETIFIIKLYKQVLLMINWLLVMPVDISDFNIRKSTCLLAFKLSTFQFQLCDVYLIYKITIQKIKIWLGIPLYWFLQQYKCIGCYFHPFGKVQPRNHLTLLHKISL